MSKKMKYNTTTKKFETMSVEEENELLKDDYKKLVEENKSLHRHIRMLEEKNKNLKIHHELEYRNIGDIVEHYVYGDIHQLRQQTNEELCRKDAEIYEKDAEIEEWRFDYRTLLDRHHTRLQEKDNLIQQLKSVIKNAGLNADLISSDVV